METITLFKTNDGTTFNTIKEANEYESLCNTVNNIIKGLNPLPKDNGCEFSNGGGYIQQNKEIVDIARIELTDLGNTILKQTDKWHFNSIGRLFDDSNKRCLYSAWCRLSHIDYKYREWGQGYFAYNPDKGVQKSFIDKI